MSWPVIGIVLLVVAMMLGPVMLMQPTKRQQGLVRIRRQALKHGLRVYLGRLAGETIAVYQKTWPKVEGYRYGGQNWCLVRQKYEHDIHFAKEWSWQGEAPANLLVLEYLQSVVTDLPQSVYAIEAHHEGLGCYWAEVGREPALQRIAEWLDTAVATLWPQVRKVRERKEQDSALDSVQGQD